MPTVADALKVFEGLSGRTLTQAEALSIAKNYNAAFGDKWFIESNPYDQATQPAQWAAWPDNATNAQLADFALTKMRSEARANLRDGRARLFERERQQAMTAAENEL